MRISSESIERSNSSLRASIGTVGYCLRVTKSLAQQANPSWECKSMLLRRSCVLNFFAVSHKNTTGNSSPLEWWILMIRTAFDRSVTELAHAQSSPRLCILSTKRKNPAIPFCPPASYSCAYSISSLRFAFRVCPYFMASTRSHSPVFSISC